MDNQKASVKKIAITYGLLLAAGTIAVSVVVYILDMHMEQHWWQSVLNFGIMVVAIVLGLKAFRTENGGFMSFVESLKTGLAISVIAGIVGAIFTYLFVTVIEPDFVAKIMEVTQDNMLEQNPNMTQEQVDSAMAITEKFMSPGVMVLFSIIGTLFFGFIISLISGLILKKDRQGL